MLDNLKMEKTYPPEVEKIREMWLAEIDRIKAKYSPDEGLTATAIAARAPSTSYELDKMQRAYRAEIDPITAKLVELEDYAELKWIAG